MRDFTQVKNNGVLTGLGGKIKVPEWNVLSDMSTTDCVSRPTGSESHFHYGNGAVSAKPKTIFIFSKPSNTTANVNPKLRNLMNIYWHPILRF